MKKLILLVVTVALSSSLFASSETTIVCPDSNEEIVALIQTQENGCFGATEIASQCAFGSSRDLAIAGAAKEVCLKEAGTLSSADQNLLATMENRCNQTYADQEGTMYMSMNAFCHLQAVNFIRSVQAEN